jgi:hypothetical protein
MTDDLIKRLRGIMSSPRNAWDTFSDTRQVPVAVLTEAADTLESQAERIAELETDNRDLVQHCSGRLEAARMWKARAEKAEAAIAAARGEKEKTHD